MGDLGELVGPMERQWVQLAPGHWRRENDDERTARIGRELRAVMDEAAKRRPLFRPGIRREWWRHG